MNNKQDKFDIFISENFIPFSGKENVIEWLDITDEKFNTFKISRKLRSLAVPLLVEGNAKQMYSINKDKINTYDDLYTFLLIEYKPINYEFRCTKSYSGPSTLSPSNLIEDASIRKNVVFDDKQKMITSTFELNDSLTQPPILRATALSDLGATNSFGDDPVNRSNVESPSVVEDNLLKEEFLIPSTATDNVIISSNSPYTMNSEQETKVPCSSISIDIGATDTIGEAPVQNVLVTSTDDSPTVIDTALNNDSKVDTGCFKRESRMSESCKIGLIRRSKNIYNHSTSLPISNTYQLYETSALLQIKILQQYIPNRVKHSVWNTMLYKKRKKIKHLSTNNFGKNSFIEWSKLIDDRHSSFVCYFFRLFFVFRSVYFVAV